MKHFCGAPPTASLVTGMNGSDEWEASGAPCEVRHLEEGASDVVTSPPTPSSGTF